MSIRINKDKMESSFIQRIVDSRNFHSNFKAFKDSIQIGDVFYIPIEEIGIEYDNTLPQIQKFVVVKKYPNCVMLEHEHKNWKFTYTHKFCPDYTKLYQIVRNSCMSKGYGDRDLCGAIA